MAREQDRWKVIASKAVDEPKELINNLLAELRQIDMKGYLPGYSKPTEETFDLADQARSTLQNHLTQLFRDVARANDPIDPDKFEQLSSALDQAIQTLKAHLYALNTWVKWIEGEIDENQGQKSKIKAIETSVEAFNEWLKVKVVPKSKSKLGTSIQFELNEVSRRDQTWLVYYATTSKGKFRIIQEDNKKWRLDKQDVTWNAVSGVEYRKPAEAAKALEEMIGGE